MFLQGDAKSSLDSVYHDAPVNIMVASVDNADGIRPPFLSRSNGSPEHPLTATSSIANESQSMRQIAQGGHTHQNGWKNPTMPSHSSCEGLPFSAVPARSIFSHPSSASCWRCCWRSNAASLSCCTLEMIAALLSLDLACRNQPRQRSDNWASNSKISGKIGATAKAATTDEVAIAAKKTTAQRGTCFQDSWWSEARFRPQSAVRIRPGILLNSSQQ